MIIKGADVAAALRERIAEIIEENGVTPKLAVIRVGEDPSNVSYEKGTIKTCEKCSVACESHVFDENITQGELEKQFRAINDDPEVTGILLLRPLPKHLDVKPFYEMINPVKDSDCMSPVNMAGLIETKSSDSKWTPCTPEAVMEAISYAAVNPEGKKAVVIGRSDVVGKPMALMLLRENATVSICHSRTDDIREALRDADIVVSCVGKADFLTRQMLELASEDVAVFDVGINFKDGKMCGDVCFDEIEDRCSIITPVPGGIGAITNTVLVLHAVKAAVRLKSR